jgi:hypothetical protein
VKPSSKVRFEVGKALLPLCRQGLLHAVWVHSMGVEIQRGVWDQPLWLSFAAAMKLAEELKDGKPKPKRCARSASVPVLRKIRMAR